MITEINKIKKVLESGENKSFHWSELRHNPGRKAFIIGSYSALLVPFSGVICMIVYTAKVFEDAGSTLSSYDSAIIVGAIQFIGSIIASNLIDRAGRKVFLLEFFLLFLKENNKLKLNSKYLFTLDFVCDFNNRNIARICWYGHLHTVKINGI